MNVFVQVNEMSDRAKSHPIGYIVCETGCWIWAITYLTHPGRGR